MTKRSVYFLIVVCLFGFLNFLRVPIRNEINFKRVWYPQKIRYEWFEKEYGINIPDEARIVRVMLRRERDGLGLGMELEIPVGKEEEFVRSIDFDDFALERYTRLSNKKDSFIVSQKKVESDSGVLIMETITFSFHATEGTKRTIGVSKLASFQQIRSGQGISQEILDWMPRYIPVGVDRWGLKY